MTTTLDRSSERLASGCEVNAPDIDISTPILEDEYVDVDPRILSWEVTPLTARVKKIKKAMMKELRVPTISAGRCTFYGRGWRAADGDDFAIRRARAIAHAFRNIPIRIGEGELIVGSQTEALVGCSVTIDYNATLGVELVEAGGAVGALSEDQKCLAGAEEVEAIARETQYWLGRSTVDKQEEVLSRYFPDGEYNKISKSRIGNIDCLATPVPGIMRVPMYEKVLKIGLRGFVNEIKEHQARLDFAIGGGTGQQKAMDKYTQLEAMRITLEGAIDFYKRHAELAADLAEITDDPVRKSELEKIAEVCDQVPERGARDFHEAVQTVWAMYLGMNIETASWKETLGRVDQYLWPMYKESVKEKGDFTVDKAAELLGCMWMKVSSLTQVKAFFGRQSDGGGHVSNSTSGGVDRNGSPADNELTYLILTVVGDSKTAYPSLFFRVHDRTSRALWHHLLQSNLRNGGGIPAIQSDPAAFKPQLRRDVKPEDALDYQQVGCTTSYPPGSMFNNATYVVNHLKILEIALNKGYDPIFKWNWDPPADAPLEFNNFEDVYEAFKAWERHFTGMMAEMGMITMAAKRRFWSLPFSSSLMPDCIEMGLGVFHGGLRYQNFNDSTEDGGFINTADALLAIKHLVFDKEVVSLDELMEALAADWEGHEPLRRLMIQGAPKFGNADPEADAFTSEIYNWTADNIRDQRYYTDEGGTKYPPHMLRLGGSMHHWRGMTIGATPDGRYNSEALAEGTVSPMRGRDISGPTAVVNSVAALDAMAGDNYVFNFRILPSMVKSIEGRDKVMTLVQSLFDQEGYQIQMNILDSEVLRAAQASPDDYSDVVVRLGGYSAYFVDLTQSMQEEQIERTAHG